jgi:hypothetical protein
MEVTMRRPIRYMTLIAAILAAGLAVAACGAGSTAAGLAPSGQRSSPAASASAPSPGKSQAGSASPGTPASPAAKSSPGPSLSLPPNPPPGCDDQPWRTTPVDVTRHVTVPPVPVVAVIRTGTHPDCGYDRIVFNIRGRMPGYDIRYVSKVVAGASGAAVAVPGRRYLLVTIHPAQGHLRSGVSTISPPSAATSYPMLRGYAVTGDFEGVVSIAVGLQRATAFRVGLLSGRLYIDVAS